MFSGGGDTLSFSVVFDCSEKPGASLTKELEVMYDLTYPYVEFGTKTPKKDTRAQIVKFRWEMFAFLGVVVLGTLQGIGVAVIVSLLSLAQQAYYPPVRVLGRKRGTDVFRARSAEHPDDESWPGLLIVRVVGRAFFLNAQGIGDRLWPLVDEMKPSVLLLDGSALIDIEYTALKMLIDGEERLRRQGVTLWLASLNGEVLEVVQQSPLGRTLGRDRMFFNLQRAVQHYETTIASAQAAHETRSVEGDPARGGPAPA